MDKVICVGKNYLKHALELGGPVPEEPTYFLKPPSSILAIAKNNQIVELPSQGEIHHEIELVFRIRKYDDQEVPKISHFTFGIDLTKRDLQASLKKAGQPWEKSKVFKNATLVGDWRPCESLEEVLSTPFQLKVNGEIRQKGLGHDMRWKPDFLLKDIQNWFPICDNDLLFTGTPEGVGPLKDGDVVEVEGGNIEYLFKCSRTKGPG